MNQLMAFRAWVLWCIGLSTILLLGGVFLLSAKKPSSDEPKEEATNDEIPLNATRTDRDLEASHGNDEHEGYDDDDVVWDIGEASDEDDIGDVSKPLRKQQPETHPDPNSNA